MLAPRQKHERTFSNGKHGKICMNAGIYLLFLRIRATIRGEGGVITGAIFFCFHFYIEVEILWLKTKGSIYKSHEALLFHQSSFLTTVGNLSYPATTSTGCQRSQSWWQCHMASVCRCHPCDRAHWLLSLVMPALQMPASSVLPAFSVI